MSHLPILFQTKTILPSIIAFKKRASITAFVNVPICWQALGHDNWIHFNSSFGKQSFDLLAPVHLSHPAFLPFLQLPLLCHSFTFLVRLTHLLLSCWLSVAFQLFFPADAHFSLRLPVCLPRSHCNPLPPSSLSFALCLRVCRWPLLAGSVTRGNWGRVHFNRTNGNKLIHFHCCFWDDVWVAGKRTESCELQKKVNGCCSRTPTTTFGRTGEASSSDLKRKAEPQPKHSTQPHNFSDCLSQVVLCGPAVGTSHRASTS